MLRLAKDLEQARANNEKVLDRKSFWLIGACILLVCQVGFWALTPAGSEPSSQAPALV